MEQNQNHSQKETFAETDTRERIIQAALNEFVDYGKAGARVDRIASTAGVNKAMIYYHFTSKENLYLEVMKSFFVALGNRARQITVETESLEEALYALAELHVTVFRRNPKLRPLMMRELAVPNSVILNRIAEAFAATGLTFTIQSRLAEGIKAGRYRDADIRQYLTAFVSLSIGYFFINPIVDRVLGIEDQEAFLDKRKRLIVEIFLDGIRAK